MANNKPTATAAKLKADNQRLKAENARLKEKANTASPRGWIGSGWRIITVIVLVALAGSLLMVANVLFWAGRTTLDNNSYRQVSAQIIKDPQVQSAIALYTTRQIFQNNDVAGTITSVLPPRAEFLAEPLTSRLEDYTNKTIATLLARPQFQQRWITVNGKVHEGILKLANSPAGQDGVVSLNEAYQAVSANLKNTKLSFLADKQLPSRVGEVTVLQSDKLRAIHILSSNLNTFKYASVALVVVLSALAIWLSKNRRRTIIVTGLVFSVLMLVTLLGLRIVSALVSGEAAPEYQTAVKHIADILSRPLVIQSYSIALLCLLAVAIAYFGSNYKSAATLRGKASLLLEGKAHKALFANENGLSKWLGRHKQLLRIAVLVLLVAFGLTMQLSPAVILALTLFGLSALVLIELLAAPPKKRSKD